MELKALPDRCEEASPLSGERYIPCNAPAALLVAFASGEGPYRMCPSCASHNTGNRGAHVVGPWPERAKARNEEMRDGT